VTSASAIPAFRPRLERRRRAGQLFRTACLSAGVMAVIVLVVLLGRIVHAGWDWLTPTLLSNYPSELEPATSGVKGALWGTIWLIALTALIAVPVGVGAAVYLQEYAPDNRLTRFIHLNISNLAGVPSIVYGILGLAVFVRGFHVPVLNRSTGMDRSIIAGALTMSLLILPVIIIATREALAAVPSSIRLAAYALAATRWQTIWHHVLPAALPGIMTGIILALSRAIGEAAPLIMIGAVTWVAFVPKGLDDPFSALPLQIYNWSDRAQPEFRHLAAAAIIVLLVVLLTMNAVAIGIRTWQPRHRQW